MRPTNEQPHRFREDLGFENQPTDASNVSTVVRHSPLDEQDLQAQQRRRQPHAGQREHRRDQMQLPCAAQSKAQLLSQDCQARRHQRNPSHKTEPDLLKRPRTIPMFSALEHRLFRRLK